MKKQISSDIRWVAFLFGIVCCILLFAIARTCLNGNATTENIIGLSMGLCASALIAYLFNTAKTVEFDSQNMYISGSTEDEFVHLSKINKVKMTNTQINNRSMWKIRYENKFGEKKAVRILPKLFNNNFEDFKEKVKQQNPQAKMRNWSHSFDFDQ